MDPTEPFTSVDPALWSHPPRELPGWRLQPATPLQTHLCDVESRMQMVGALDETVTRIVARLHDIGKLTTWFQRHIRGESVHPIELTHHAHVGGAIADYALRVTEVDPTARLAGTLAILKHHGALPDMAGAETAFAQQFGDPHGGNAPTYARIDAKLEDIHSNDAAREVAEALIEGVTNGAGSWAECRKAISNREGLPTLATKAEAVVAHAGTRDEEAYGQLVDTWTTLTLADTTSAAHLDPADLTSGRLEATAIEEYISTFDPAPDSLGQTVNTIRDTARVIALNRVEEFLEADTNVGRITLPTGFGKTLTSTQAGLSLAEQKAARTGQASRVVYALPFTSIIDQTADELEAIYPDAGPLDLAVHHHLADVSPDETAFETDALAERDRVLIRDAWRQQFTLTTFVQLFESLAGPRKSQGLKLPALRNAVIILDEPQALPPEWMHLVNRLCRVLTDQYNAHLIALTATQPKLFEAFEYTEDPFTLVGPDESAYRPTPSPEACIQQHPRVCYTLHPSADPEAKKPPLAPGEAADILVENLDSPALAICNTVSSSRALAEQAQEQIGGASLNERFQQWTADQQQEDVDLDAFVASLPVDEPIVVHLTSRHRPFDRLSLIGVAKRLCKQKTPLLCISTQLIEAGVDISFDSLYRDFAPVPSLVQAAGRCNRSFGTDRQTVCVWRLTDNAGRLPSEIIYSRLAFGDPLAATTQALNHHRTGATIDEVTMISEVVDAYFETYHETAGTATTSLPELVDAAKCATLSEVHLIDQAESLDVIVPGTSAEAETISRLAAEGSADALATAREMRQSTVSIPAYTETTELEQFKTQLLTISGDDNLYALPSPSAYDAFYGVFDSSSGR